MLSPILQEHQNFYMYGCICLLSYQNKHHRANHWNNTIFSVFYFSLGFFYMTLFLPQNRFSVLPVFSILFEAILKYSSSFSIPMKFLPFLTAATPVVPLPMKGSNIISSLLV